MTATSGNPNAAPSDDGPANPTDSSARNTPLNAVVSIVVGVGLVIVAYIGFFRFPHILPAAPIAINLLAGLVLLTVSLAGLIIIFRALSLDDANAALGMPPGSVRALLALTLIVVFVVVASWELRGLYDPNSALKETAQIPNGKVEEFKLHNAGARMTVMPGPGDGQSTVTLYVPRDAEIQDLAKQVMTIVATVLVTVVGFYFGSNSAADAARTANATIRSVQAALSGSGQDGGAGAGAAAPPSATDLAKTSAAIGALAAAAQKKIADAEQQCQLLREAVTKAGDAGKPLQPSLTDAEKALLAMKAKAQALAADADRAKTAADAAAASVTPDKLKAGADRTAQLNTDATQANHDLDEAAKAFEAARQTILKQTAQG